MMNPTPGGGRENNKNNNNNDIRGETEREEGGERKGETGNVR